MARVKIPDDLTPRGRGRALWKRILDDLELEAHEEQLLHEACRILDRLDSLNEAVREHGVLLPDGRVQPAVVECRQQGLALARIVATLRLPDEYRAEVLERGQRRGAARSPYHLREVSEVNRGA